MQGGKTLALYAKAFIYNNYRYLIIGPTRKTIKTVILIDFNNFNSLSSKSSITLGKAFIPSCQALNNLFTAFSTSLPLSMTRSPIGF